jgi:methylphosphotriester-DNA--protein-cysteine methyltransferase
VGSYKKELCKKGHELKEPNLCYNSEGFRECRRCKQDRKYKARKEKRNDIQGF